MSFLWAHSTIDYSYYYSELEDYRLDLNPFTMLVDALRWNLLNVIRVELFFNCYRLWNIFISSSINSPRGQYALVSFIITLLAQFAAQFSLSWLLTIYTIYLIIGSCVWLKRRVYFYHRKLDQTALTQTINNHFGQAKQAAAAAASGASNLNNANGSNNATGTLSKTDKHNHRQTTSGDSADHTDSLQRQRVTTYREFQSILNEPRRNHREYAISLFHLSHIAKLVADRDVFDEMHFQILATRRDVVNMLLRSVLIIGATLLVFLR